MSPQAYIWYIDKNYSGDIVATPGLYVFDGKGEKLPRKLDRLCNKIPDIQLPIDNSLH